MPESNNTNSPTHESAQAAVSNTQASAASLPQGKGRPRGRPTQARKNQDEAISQGKQIRIAFFLDRDRDPYLAHLFDIHEHGGRPRELLRLAKLGLEKERELKELQAAAMKASLDRLLMSGVGHPAVHEAVSPQVDGHAAQAVAQAPAAKPAEPVRNGASPNPEVASKEQHTQESGQQDQEEKEASEPGPQTTEAKEPVQQKKRNAGPRPKMNFLA